MRKRFAIAATTFLGASFISSLHHVLVTYPGTFTFTGDTYWFELTYLILRFLLPILFGWILASKWYKGYKINKNNVASRFFRRTHLVWKVTLLVLILHTARTFVWFFYRRTFDVIWHIFVDPPGIIYGSADAIMPGVIMARIPVSIYETLFSFPTHISIALMYLSYSLRVTLYSSDNSP